MENMKISLPTWQEHMTKSIQHEKINPGLSSILTDIAKAGSLIGTAIRNYGLISEITGGTTQMNLHGEHVKKLDLYANTIFIELLKQNSHCAAIVSEEEPEAIQTGFDTGKYLIFLDPLDGSSNIDTHVSTGSIFSIYKKNSMGGIVTKQDLLQCGKHQVAAGYILYSSSIVMVYSCGFEVQGLTFHSGHDTYYVTHPAISMPSNASVYSINEGNIHHFPEHIRNYLHHCKTSKSPGASNVSLRYVGSMVADMHRNMLKGGVFMYPSTKENSNGKLRLMYECNPFAYLVEKAGGKATNGLYKNVLDIEPKDIHERCPIVIGSKSMMHSYEQFLPPQELKRNRYHTK